jgi:hypothetical protein
MVSPHDPIVDFENPPVAEVGLSVQLQGATLDTSRAISAFFPTVQQHYPKIVAQPPAPPIEESFEIPSQATIAFQLLGGPESQRWAFVSEDELETLEAQSTASRTLGQKRRRMRATPATGRSATAARANIGLTSMLPRATSRPHGARSSTPTRSCSPKVSRARTYPRW